MKYLSLLLLLVGYNCFAGDTWLCTEESSVRTADVIKACGMGYGRSEARARAAAFKTASLEFHRTCDASTDCRGHEITVRPQRTTCEQEMKDFERLGQWKCYRLVVYTIESGMDTKSQPTPVTLAKVQQKPYEGWGVARCMTLNSENSAEQIQAYNECIENQ